FHVGALAVIGFDVALLVQLHLPGEQLGVGLVADGHEHGLGGNLAGLPRLHVADADAGDGLVPQDLLHYRVPDEADLGIGHGPVLHDLAGPELVPAMDYGNAPADVAQEQSLFHGGVAAAHHHHVPVSEEEAVAGGAAGYAAAHQPAFGFKAEPLGLGAGGDDDGLGQVGVVAHFYLEGPLGEVHGRGVGVDEPGAEAFRLPPEAHHQFGAHDAVGEAGVVLHLGGEHKLPACLHAGDDQRFQVGAGRVQGCGQAGRAAADDYYAFDLHWVHLLGQTIARRPNGGFYSTSPGCRMGGRGTPVVGEEGWASI